MNRGVLKQLFHISPEPVRSMLVYLNVSVLAPVDYYGISFIMAKLNLAYEQMLEKIIGKRRYKQFKINKIIRYASKNCRFYRHLGASRLNELPIIQKKVIQKRKNEFESGQKYVTVRTSGTTGTPLEVDIDKLTEIYKTIEYESIYRRSGYRPSDWFLTVESYSFIKNRTRRKYIIDEYQRRIIFSAVANTKEDFLVLENLLKKYNPRYIRSMPSFMYKLSLSVRGRHRFNTWFCDRETMLNFQKKKIKQVFRCNIVDIYNLSEIQIMASKKENQSFYSVPSHLCHLELQDNKIIATSLTNKSMPLIRYDTSDLAESKNGRITRIKGRESEVIKSGGRFIYPTTLSILTDQLENIDMLQFVKGKQHIMINYVSNSQKDEEIRQVFERYIGKVKTNKVKEIKIQGKFQFVK